MRTRVCLSLVCLLADFRATLDKFKVPAAEQGELVAIVESTKPDIVVGK